MYACSCQFGLGGFEFCRCARFGFGKCKASFLTLWEKTLRTCPKPSPANSDNTTTVLDNKTKIFFSQSIFCLIKCSRERTTSTRSSRKHGDHGAPPPLVRNHAKTWWEQERHRQQKYWQTAGVSAHWFHATADKKSHILTLKTYLLSVYVQISGLQNNSQ